MISYPEVETRLVHFQPSDSKTSIPANQNRPMASLKGKVIAIIGAASGIGLALAQLAGAGGAKLALADI
jgi:NADPH:quinone reductase-like Zn-dependent oxidoreductase